MSELPSRCRKVAADMEAIGFKPDRPLVVTLKDAADEIERLREALEMITTVQDGEQSWYARDLACRALRNDKSRAINRSDG